MIGLGSRLAVAGGRRSVLALALTAAAVAVGTAMLLLALTVEPAYAARDARSGIYAGQATFLGADDARPDRYTAVRPGNDAFRDQEIDVIDMAGVGVDPPHPAGLALPAPGEMLVSPALAELAAREPLLAQRYPPDSPLLPDTVVPGPDSLLAVRGMEPPSPTDQAAIVVAFPQSSPDAELGPVLRLLLVIGAIAMLAPIVIFVATATRLTAAGRERRMAALRLAGASTTQVARLAGVEALLTGVAGAVAGLALFFLVRPLATYVTVDDRWYTTDLLPTPAGFTAALVGVPLAALLGSQLALTRVAVSPFGVGRRARPRPLRAWRLLPLLVAVPLFAFVVLGARIGVAPVGGDVWLGGSFALVLGALLLSGPWLARTLGAVLARSGSAAAVLAGRRLTADPRGGFRAVAGAVVGSFVAAMFLTVLPAARTEIDPVTVSGLAADAAIGYASDEAEAGAALGVLRGVPGVSPTLVRTTELAAGGSVWLGDCTMITRLTANDPASCAPGRVLVGPAAAGATILDFGNGRSAALPGPAVLALAPGAYERPEVVLPAGAVALPADRVVVRVGILAAPDALERARTALSAAGIPVELATAALRTARSGVDDSKLTRVLLGAMIGTFVVAGCSGAVAAATGLLERRRSFALLRLTGTPLGVLRRAALLELAVPLVATSILGALLGVLTGRLIGLGGGADEPVPWLALGGPLSAGLVIALALGGLALPLVRRVSEGDGTRFE